MSQEIKIKNYDEFKCIAGECSLTCCQEWRIAVDEKTKKKWKGQSIQDEQTHDKVMLHECLVKDEDGQIIRLNQEKKCPFLNENKLCQLVNQLGEDFLSKTCTTFPRQMNSFSDRKEYVLTACCPVVVDKMKEQKPELMADGLVVKDEEEALLYEVRQMMLHLVEEKDYSIPESMMMIFYNLLELYEREAIDKKSVEEKIAPVQKNELIKAIRKMSFSQEDALIESNELFLDVVENYRKQGLYVPYLEPIAQIAEKLSAKSEYGLEAKVKAEYEQFEKTLVQYESLLKHYVMGEILGSSLLPDSSLEDMVTAFEWITLEYCVVRQALFLKWLEQGETLSYEAVRDYLSVIARVTGYDACDTYEYLENSFEDVIWDWGYLAMILGHSQF